MKKPHLPTKFVEKCKAITAKRPKTVINHILKHGFITTEDLKNMDCTPRIGQNMLE